MRIISGLLKGKKILQPKDKTTRPLKDLTKESIFNIIKHSNKFSVNIEGAIILDIFSGVGSFGLESLSRGSEKVIFIENYKLVLDILKKNVNNLNLSKKCQIIEKNVMGDFNLESLNQRFNIIFLDPPFKLEDTKLLINQIFISNILKENGIIIIHKHSKSNNDFPKIFNILEEKKYGLSKIIFGNF